MDTTEISAHSTYEHMPTYAIHDFCGSFGISNRNQIDTRTRTHTNLYNLTIVESEKPSCKKLKHIDYNTKKIT